MAKKILLKFLLLVLFAVFMQTAVFADFTYEPHPPVFSHPAGTYDSNFTLTITAEEGTTIRFTLDGSTPSTTSPIFPGTLEIHSPPPTEANNPLSMGAFIGGGWGHISNWDPGEHYYRHWWWHDYFPRTPRLYYNAMVVRARAFNDEGIGSATVTHTFFVERGGRGHFNTRVVSISIDPQYFIDPVIGMYTNWQNRDLRHMGYAEIFYPDGTLMLSQEAQLRVSGHWSRRHPKKSLRLNFGQGGGTLTNMPDLIPDTRQSFYSPLCIVSDFHHLSMRLSDWDRTTLRDTVATRISEPLRIDTQNATYGAVFVNGEFWGMYEFRENRSGRAMAARYLGIHRNSIVMLDWSPGSVNNDQVLSEDDPLFPWAGPDGIVPVGHPLRHVDFDYGRDSFEREAYASWMRVMDTILNTDMSLPENYEYLKTLVDIDNMIDYFIVFYHFDNWDWPGNNFITWRTETYYPGIPGGDTRWRFFMHDFDEAINAPYFDRMHHFTTTGAAHIPQPSWAGAQPEWAVGIWYNLFQNEEFRNTLAARYSTYTGTVFHSSRTNAIIDELVDYRYPTITSEFYRWRLDGRHGSNAWIWQHAPWGDSGIMYMRHVLERRANYSIVHLRNYFNRTDRANLNARLDTSGLTNIRWIADCDMGFFDISGAQIRADLFDRGNIDNYDFSIGDFNANYIRGLPITVTAVPLAGYEFAYFRVSLGNISQTYYDNPMVLIPPARSARSITVQAVFRPV